MNIKLLGAFLAAFAMSGCIINSNGGGGGGGHHERRPGDVTLQWSFAGGSCFDVPDVKTVVVNIPGEVLQNDGAYPCSANNFPGIVLHDFAPGPYDFTIDAWDYGNQRIFQASGSFTVDGNVSVKVDLAPIGTASSYAYLTWSFPPNQLSNHPNCTQAGVTSVDVSIDGAPWERFDCRDGITSPGIPTRYMAPGLHSISLVGVGADGIDYYRFDGNLQTFAGRSVAAEYFLNWAVGGTAISWQLTNGSVAETCAQAGVTTVYVNFEDRDGNLVYGNTWDPQPCNGTPVFYDYLTPGTYKVYLDGVGKGGVHYQSNFSTAPVVKVEAGVFADQTKPKVVQMFQTN